MKILKDEGKYAHLWMKYTAVIHVLVKKTDTENQKLQLYKHEFEQSGKKQVPNFSFSIDLINGKASNVVTTTAIARDLWEVLNNNSKTRNMLKERSIRISIDNSLEMSFEKI